MGNTRSLLEQFLWPGHTPWMLSQTWFSSETPENSGRKTTEQLFFSPQVLSPSLCPSRTHLATGMDLRTNHHRIISSSSPQSLLLPYQHPAAIHSFLSSGRTYFKFTCTRDFVLVVWFFKISFTEQFRFCNWIALWALQFHVKKNQSTWKH